MEVTSPSNNYPRPDWNKCRTCGFFAVVPLGHGGSETMYYEVSEEMREEGEAFGRALYPNASPSQVQPVCARGKRQFVKEINDRKTADADSKPPGTWTVDDTVVLRGMLEEPQDCGSWWPYTPMRSPQQHLEDYQMQQLERDRREFELKLFNMSQKVQEDSKKIAQKVTLFFVILALLEVTFGGLQYWQGTRPLEVRSAIPVVQATATPVPPTPTPIPPTPTPDTESESRP